MSIYAIAAFVKDNAPVGARLLNTESGKVQDYLNSDIEYMMTQGYNFKNLEVSKGKLNWSSGVFSRYPQIAPGGAITNGSTVTVVGVMTGDTKKFKVVNFQGNVVMATESELIAFGERNGISNCKIVGKGNGKFIQSIAGEIDELKSEMTIRILGEDTIEIQLPEDGSVEDLVIPKIINGTVLNNIDYIKVSPKSAAAKIKRLSLPEPVKFIGLTTVSNFPNLEVLVAHSDRMVILDGALSGMAKLRDVVINKVAYIYTKGFMNCPNLENVTFKQGCDFIGPEAFKGCPKLNIQKLFNCRIKCIEGREVFAKNPTSILLIPDSCERINYNTFAGMPNLTKLKFDNPSMQIGRGYYDHKHFQFTGELWIKERSGLIQTAIKSGHDAADNYMFPATVKVNLIAVDDEDKNVVKTLAKSTLSGMSNSRTLEYNKKKDVAIILGSRKPEEVHDFIINAINNIVNAWSYEPFL